MAIFQILCPLPVLPPLLLLSRVETRLINFLFIFFSLPFFISTGLNFECPIPTQLIRSNLIAQAFRLPFVNSAHPELKDPFYWNLFERHEILHVFFFFVFFTIRLVMLHVSDIVCLRWFMIRLTDSSFYIAIKATEPNSIAYCGHRTDAEENIRFC